MPSYVVTGGRGLGYEFANQLSSDPANVVFSLVRDEKVASKLAALAAERNNLHILVADITDLPALRKAAETVSSITGGTLDVLINNAALSGVDSARFKGLTGYIGEEEGDLTKSLMQTFTVNTVGPIYTTNTFIPLLRAGAAKKVITISTGFADLDVTILTGIALSVPYSVSKAAVNMVNAKYAAELKDEGFTFLAIAPGFVKTTQFEENASDPSKVTPEAATSFEKILKGFYKLKPDFDLNRDWISPPESVGLMLNVVNKATVEDNGAFISQFGNKTWL